MDYKVYKVLQAIQVPEAYQGHQAFKVCQEIEEKMVQKAFRVQKERRGQKVPQDKEGYEGHLVSMPN
jgi:hypothetical protein